MSLAAEVENGDTIVKNRFLGFLIWESIHSTAIFVLCKSLLISPFTRSPLTPSLLSFAAFIAFHLSLLLFSTAVVASSHPNRGASPWELALGIVKLVFVPGGVPMAIDFHRRVKISFSFLLFVTVAAFSGFASVICICWSCGCLTELQPRRFRAFVAGLFYGLYYVYKRRWILQFPIIHFDDYPGEVVLQRWRQVRPCVNLRTKSSLKELVGW